ncbi:MAG: hypothetical protein Kow0065_08310 [Methylomicrobium sp.]
MTFPVVFRVSVSACWALALCAALPACTMPSKDSPVWIAYDNAAARNALPTIRERMIYLARQEWTLFGRPVADYAAAEPVLIFPDGQLPTHESQPPFLARVLTYWQAATPAPLLDRAGDIRPWSGAFIVWLARSAGVSEPALPSTALHWDYIEQALLKGRNARFDAHDARYYPPKPGDLLCAPRSENFTAQVRRFEQLRRGPYHCDLVVARARDRLEVIGGNVLDAVSLTRVELNSDGTVRPFAERPWLIVIEQRDVD